MLYILEALLVVFASEFVALCNATFVTVFANRLSMRTRDLLIQNKWKQ